MQKLKAILQNFSTWLKQLWTSFSNKMKAFYRVFLRWLKQFWRSFLEEFSLNNLNLRATTLVTSILQSTKLFCVVVGSYLLLRFILLKTLFTNEEFLESLRQAEKEGWFEAIFLVLLLSILATTLLRLISPIRFSATFSWICLLAFLLYMIEKYKLSTFEFLSSDYVHQDYFMILALPPIFEIFLRLVYSLFRPKLRNRSIFLENQPIENDNKDETTRNSATTLIARQLNRSYFEHSYSIGVVGDWGVGKTSFYKSLKSKIENAIIIHFNPWLSTGKNSLLQEFIESLKDDLGKYDRSLVFDLDKYLNSLVELESQTKTSFAKVIQNLTKNRHSSSAELAHVQKAIKRLGKRIIIIIDDLDRLSKEEIFDVLKLIRNTGDFSNTVYISCYDKIYLLHALQHFSKRNLNILLDKFFDLEVPLAPFPPKAMVDHLFKHFFFPYSIPKERSELLLSEIGDHTFSQLREVKKFITSLSLDYTLYGRTLHFHDFFILQVLKVKFPFIPDLISKRRSRFFIQDGFPPILKLAREDKESEEILIGSYLNSNERDEFTKIFLSGEDRDLIIRLLHLLFPEKTLGDPYALQEPDFFMNYFYHSIPDSKVHITNWFRAIQDETYFTDEFFKEPYDGKKESVILEALFVNGTQFISIFQSQPQVIFKFLFFLVDWSGGRIAVLPFFNAFSLLKIVGQEAITMFSKNLVNEPLAQMQIEARTNFISTILRSYISDSTFTLQFANVEQLKADNFRLFNAYMKNSTEITNGTFNVFFHQIESIDSETNRVKLESEAIKQFKVVVEKFPVSFLDLIVRAASIPNFGEYTFAPYTISGLFESKSDLEQFIKSAKYPEYRKKKLLEYLEQSQYDSNYARYTFFVKDEELETMPFEFTNAWATTPEVTRKKVKQTNNEWDITLNNQPTPPNRPDLNDHIVDDIFEVNEGTIEISITPDANTDFWRFGLKFSETKDFPSTADPRHSVNNPDITIAIGKFDGQDKWEEKGMLKLEHPNFPNPQANFFKEKFTYTGDPVKLIIHLTQQPDNYITVELINGTDSRGTHGHKLNGMKYFRLSAWCDKRSFSLQVKIVKKMRVDGQIVDAKSLAIKPTSL